MTEDGAQVYDFAQRYTEAWCSQDPTTVANRYAATGSLTTNGGCTRSSACSYHGGRTIVYDRAS